MLFSYFSNYDVQCILLCPCCNSGPLAIVTEIFKLLKGCLHCMICRSDFVM